MAVRAGKLRAVAKSILEQLEGWDDEEMVETRCNTYGMYGTILETSEGFVDPWDLRPCDDYDDDDDGEVDE